MASKLAMSRRSCINNQQSFCYACEHFTSSDQIKNVSARVNIAYNYYFGCKAGDQEKNWAPHTVCGTCYSGLTQWLIGKRKGMPLGMPMVLREPQGHTNDCYFYLTKIKGFNKKVKGNMVYPDCESALKPVKHSGKIPVPLPPTTWECDESKSDTNKSDIAVGYASQPDTDLEFEDKSLHLITQEEQNDFIRDLTLSKEKSDACCHAGRVESS